MFKLLKLGALGLLLVTIYSATVTEIPQVKPVVDHSVSYGIRAIQRAKTYTWTDLGIMAAGLAGVWWLTKTPRKLWGAWKGRGKAERPDEVVAHMQGYVKDVGEYLNQIHDNLARNKVWVIETGPLTAMAVKRGAKKRWGKAVEVRIEKTAQDRNNRKVRATKSKRAAKRWLVSGATGHNL